jgi:serine/threonine protein kinase
MSQTPFSYDQPESVAFRREAAMLAGVTHPGLARIHEVGYARGRPFLIMDLVAGQNLHRVLTGGQIDEARAVAIGVDVAGALAAAHRAGVVHRDLKPKNVMIQPDGRAKVIDFGLAQWVADERDDSVAGTFTYMAPEQTGMLRRIVDGRTDLYSLGATLFQCVTGRPPFVSPDVGELMRLHAVVRPPDVREVRPDISPVFAAILAKLLAKDPDDRYQSGDGLVADLERLSADGGSVLFSLGSRDVEARPCSSVASQS